ncbi:MAG: CapA family protein [Lachnospiraceae bacterium]|nr:CapA family protein [Lachnospiraceae bacterium]
MKKTWKTIIIFLATLSVTVIAGCIVLLIIYQIRKNENDTAVLSDTAYNSVIQDVENDPAPSYAGAYTGDDISETATAAPVDASPDLEAADDIPDEQMQKLAEDTLEWEEGPSDIETEAQPEGSQKSPVTMVFTGDICFHDPFANMGAYRQRGSSIDNCIDETLLSQMRSADICMVNNEFPYSDRGTPLEGKTYTFRSRPENVHILTDMGVDIAGIANNHAFDHGQEAFLDTLDILDNEGIAHVGGGKNLEEASSPVLMEVNGIKTGFVAATQIERTGSPDTRGATNELPGVMRCFSDGELERFLEEIRLADRECDFLVVFVHWGSENTDVLDFRQTDQAEAFAQAGADLIVGCHPHCLQGLGQVGSVPVIYSLGNYWFNSKTVDTALLKVVIDGEGIQSLQMIAARQHDCRTDHMEGSEAQRIYDYLNSISRDGVSLDSDGYMIR